MAGMHSPLRIPVGRSSDFIMHIYSCDHWVLKGSVSHVQSGRSLAFQSMMELVLAIQAKMDEQGYPQSSTAYRSWQSSQPGTPDCKTQAVMESTPAADMMPEAILASFLVRIQFRQNASWQGTLVWMDRKESCPFRSLLELAMLVADALNIHQTQEIETEASLTAITWTLNNPIS